MQELFLGEEVFLLERCPLFQGLNYMQELFLGEEVFLLERCPHFRG